MKNRFLKGNSIPFVSVIVPVYNDSQNIRKCIEALLSQTYPEKYEVLIVDNGSTDETRTVVRKYPVRLLMEDQIQSSYAARNKGILNAQGQVIALTDADCIPSSDWLVKGVANLMRVPNCGLVAGRINLCFRELNKPNAVELYESVMRYKQKEYIEKERYGATANVFTFKNVFDNVGLFNDKLKSGGDNEWGRRVFSFGYKQIYADDTCVAHPARYSFAQLHQRIARLTGGCYDQYWKDSYKAFLEESIQGIKNILSHSARITFNKYPYKGLNGLKNKIQFFFVIIAVEVLRKCERTRLVLGGSSKRG